MFFIGRSRRVCGFPVPALAVLAMAACSTPSEPDPSPLTACSDPRPQVCTMIYRPVCAVHDDGSRETLASDCNACADSTVSGYLPEPCEDLNTP